MRTTLCALLLLSLAAVAPARQQRPPQQRVLVEAVEIEGNRRLTDEELFARVRIRPGDTYDERRVQRDFQSLLDLGIFDTTATRFMIEDGVRGGKVVVFQVVELPLVGGLRLKGLPRGVTRADVLRAMRANGAELKRGAPFEPASLRRAVAAVETLLRARGLPGLSVKGWVEQIELHRVLVAIEIGEGGAF
jgi:outer membrane protein assembly factor BamA